MSTNMNPWHSIYDMRRYHGSNYDNLQWWACAQSTSQFPTFYVISDLLQHFQCFVTFPHFQHLCISNIFTFLTSLLFQHFHCSRGVPHVSTPRSTWIVQPLHSSELLPLNPELCMLHIAPYSLSTILFTPHYLPPFGYCSFWLPGHAHRFQSFAQRNIGLVATCSDCSTLLWSEAVKWSLSTIATVSALLYHLCIYLHSIQGGSFPPICISKNHLRLPIKCSSSLCSTSCSIRPSLLLLIPACNFVMFLCTNWVLYSSL